MRQAGTKQENSGAIAVAQAIAAHAVGVPMAAIAAGAATGDRQVIRGRQLAIYLSRAVLRQSLREVARAFGRAHPTVLHACRRIEEAREDPTFDRTVEWLEMAVRRAAGAPA